MVPTKPLWLRGLRSKVSVQAAASNPLHSPLQQVLHRDDVLMCVFSFLGSKQWLPIASVCTAFERAYITMVGTNKYTSVAGVMGSLHLFQFAEASGFCDVHRHEIRSHYLCTPVFQTKSCSFCSLTLAERSSDKAAAAIQHCVETQCNAQFKVADLAYLAAFHGSVPCLQWVCRKYAGRGLFASVRRLKLGGNTTGQQVERFASLAAALRGHVKVLLWLREQQLLRIDLLSVHIVLGGLRTRNYL